VEYHPSAPEYEKSMRARLIVETGAASPQLSDLSPKETIRLGRNSKNDVVLDDPHASRWHAEVYSDAQSWYVRDRRTTNGTKVNGVKIQEPTLLANNHVISIGDARLRFTLDSSAQGTEELPVIVPQPKNNEKAPAAPQSSGDFNPTILHADELTALLHF